MTLFQLPQELIEVAAKLSVSSENERSGRGTTASKLAEAMERIASVSTDVEASIKEIKHCLEDDKQQEEEYAAIVGQGEAKGSQVHHLKFIAQMAGRRSKTTFYLLLTIGILFSQL